MLVSNEIPALRKVLIQRCFVHNDYCGRVPPKRRYLPLVEVVKKLNRSEIAGLILQTGTTYPIGFVCGRNICVLYSSDTLDYCKERF